MQDQFDVYHVNIGNGELVLPFSRFVKKPIIITLHGHFLPTDAQEYFRLLEHQKNVYFVAISNSQRSFMPQLNYIRTIYHGVDVKRNFKFSANGGNSIMWAGRAIPEKGLDVVLQVIKATKKEGHLFMLTKTEFLEWLENKILKRLHSINRSVSVNSEFNLSRLKLVPKYQNSKLFLFPVQWEEPFGLVMAEAMACGTPVVAYARGSVPEVVKDGVTGFVVNPSDDDIRGNFIIIKTGVEGLCEAVERIYAMSESEYKQMRLDCRRHVEKNFSVSRMVQEYIDIYKQVTTYEKNV
jgi:glycosyltransferase involved in cell wall biosynthesis